MFRKFIARLLKEEKKESINKANPIPLEKQLEDLSACGIQLREDATIDSLLLSFPKENYEIEPYQLLLTVMGGEREEEPYTNFSDNIFYLDTECIDGHGSYVDFAKRIWLLTGQELAMTDINDSIEPSTGKASLSFKIDGQPYEWHATINDDWLDPLMLSKFARLVKEHNMKKQLCCHYFPGQDCLIGYSSEDELKRLNELTGLKFNWLE